MDRGRVTWTCHVCGRERDDADIAVYSDSKPIAAGRTDLWVNVRYCADSATCAGSAVELAEAWLRSLESESA